MSEANTLVQAVTLAIEKEAPVRFEANFGLSAPEDHTADYDAAIEMLEWHEEPQVVLSVHEFQCYVRNKWDWTSRHRATVAAYSGPAGGIGDYVAADAFAPMRRFSKPLTGGEAF